MILPLVSAQSYLMPSCFLKLLKTGLFCSYYSKYSLRIAGVSIFINLKILPVIFVMACSPFIMYLLGECKGNKQILILYMMKRLHYIILLQEANCKTVTLILSQNVVVSNLCLAPNEPYTSSRQPTFPAMPRTFLFLLFNFLL